MPGCLIDEEQSVTAWRDLGGDFGKMARLRPMNMLPEVVFT